MSNETETKNFIEEIKREARSDVVWRFFYKHKNLAKIAAISFLAILILYFIFAVSKGILQEKYSEIFHQSMIYEESKDLQKAKDGFVEIYEANFAPHGVKGLAALRLAALLVQENQNDKALEIYKNVAKNMFYNDFVQETSALVAVKMLVNDYDTKSDKKTQEKTVKEIANLAKGNKILRDSFREQQAIFMIKIGEKNKARNFLEEIVKSEVALKSQKERASSLINLTN